MFTDEHFIWLAICFVFIAVLTVLSVRLKFSFRTSAFIMAAASLISETSKILSHMKPVDKGDPSMGMVLEPTALPLHLCSLLIFAFFYLPFCKNEKVKNFLVSLAVPVGIIGSLLALLMATSGTDFTAPEPYQCFLYHATMIWFSLYLLITKQVDLGVRAWLRNMGTLLGLAVGMIWVNSALKKYETNFFYVVRPPVDGLPILNLDNGWYVYFATILMVGFIAVTLIHLPALIGELKYKKQNRLQ